MAAISDGTGVNGTLAAYLGLLNQTPPITACQFEIWYSKWPRVKWFAQDISVPGVQNKLLQVYYNGIPTDLVINSEYTGHTIDMTMLDDEFGVNYAAWRDFVIIYGQEGYKGKPIINGVMNADGVYQGGGYIIVKLLNSPLSPSQHIWRLHNFKPTKVGEMQFSQDKKSLVTFNVSGVFTHITFVQKPDDQVALSGAGKKVTVY